MKEIVSRISKFDEKWNAIKKDLKIDRKYDSKSKPFKSQPKDP